jgi:glycosyltransferase involved in cell wall biosynthesis
MADSIGAIHAHDPHVAYPLLGRFPVVYTHHARGSLASESDMSPIRPSRSVVSLWRQIDEDVFNKSAAVVFPSMGAYRLAVEEYPSLAARNVQIIYTGIPDVFGPRRESRAGQQRTVLTISAHVPDKKVPAALEAFHRYLLQGRRAQHTHFVSLGSYGPDTATLRSYSERWKLEGRVSLLGRVSRDQTVEWLRRAWVFIHMPDRAVFDLALLEALSAGIPVIASPVQGNVEMLGDDWPGYARSAEEAALLLGALADEGLWRDWSRRARARFEGCFTLEKMARSYLALYDEVIRGCR